MDNEHCAICGSTDVNCGCDDPAYCSICDGPTSKCNTPECPEYCNESCHNGSCPCGVN